jgi:hypothetical protein
VVTTTLTEERSGRREEHENCVRLMMNERKNDVLCVTENEIAGERGREGEGREGGRQGWTPREGGRDFEGGREEGQKGTCRKRNTVAW